PAVAEACLACADRLWAQDKQQEATALIDGLRHAAVPQRFRVAATHRAILAPGPLALPLLVEQLKSADDALFAAAVSASRRLPGGEVTQALVAELDRSPPARQILLVAALGDRREPAVVRALEKVAAAGAMEVRLTAIRVLGQLGETSAARKAAGASNSELREAAIRTLGHIAGPDDLPLLWNRLQTANSARETDIAKEALSAACLRISDRDASVARLADYIEHAPASAQCFLLELIGRMGGPRALAVVVAGAHKSGEVQATALQALGAWMSPDAAPPLLELAKTLPDDRLQTRALRGYLRIARQMDLTPDARLAMCQEALRAARRDDERKLALQALVRTASANSLTVAVEHLAQPGLREEAALAAVAIAEKIAPREPQAVAAAMRQVLRSGVSGQPAVRARQLLEKRN
ncbi:MAG: HEAT repeat domain-containing protein, partial [Thermoguttaceae bacterium]